MLLEQAGRWHHRGNTIVLTLGSEVPRASALELEGAMPNAAARTRPRVTNVRYRAANTARTAPRGPLRSLRFRGDSALADVATGKLRLGRPNDPPFPAPIRSTGPEIAKVQEALIDLGYPIESGADGSYGQATYNAVLAYKTRYNIRTDGGYLDGIVGTKTITLLDRTLPMGPLPRCPLPAPPVVGAALVSQRQALVQRARVTGGMSIDPVPWITCTPPQCSARYLTLPQVNKRFLLPAGYGEIGRYCLRGNVHVVVQAEWKEQIKSAQARNLEQPKYRLRFVSNCGGLITPWIVPGPTKAWTADFEYLVPGSYYVSCQTEFDIDSTLTSNRALIGALSLTAP